MFAAVAQRMSTLGGARAKSSAKVQSVVESAEECAEQKEEEDSSGAGQGNDISVNKGLFMRGQHAIKALHTLAKDWCSYGVTGQARGNCLAPCPRAPEDAGLRAVR